MVDGATAGEATGEMPAVSLQGCHVALVERVLVSPEDDGPLVLPQVEDALTRSDVVKQALLEGDVAVGVGAVGVDDRDALDHRASCPSANS